ncbi:MAG TPA: CdaR family protein [Tissierellaceae bacterium]
MSKKIQENSLTPKILALVIAIILWINVMDEVDPLIEIEYPDIPVEYINADNLAKEGLIILEPKESTIRVKVAGNKSNMNQFSSNNISAKVDLENVTIGKNTVSVDLKLVNNISNIRLVDYKPREVVFSIDQIGEASKDIAIELLGELPEGYVLDDVVVEPTEVKITGPKSYINKIHQVVARIDLTDKTEAFNKSVPLEILDIDGESIKGITRNPSMVNISVPIHRKQTVPINLKTINELPSHYRLLEMELIPDKVDLKIKNNKTKITSIDTKPIDVTKLIGGSSYEVELDLPKDVELANPNEKFILNYKLEEIGAKIFNYTASDVKFINLDDRFEVVEESITGIISLILDERNEEVSQITQDMVNISLDFSNVAVGENKVPIVVEGIPDNFIKSVNPKNISVEIREKE